MMDPETLLELANQTTKIKPFPYLDIAHCAITCFYVREDIGSGALPFSRKHPLSTWMSCMLAIFGGAILANFLLGEPVLSAVKSDQHLVLATAVWYLVFYSPFDIGYKFVKFLPVKLVLSCMKEVYRCRKVYDGVVHASRLFPASWFVMIAIGTVKGSGNSFVKVVERLFRGVWTPNAMEMLALGFPTKASLVTAVIFVIDKKTDLIAAPHALVYFGITIFLLYFKVSSLLLGIHDPIAPLENLFCAIFMGGVCDALQRAVSGRSAASSTDTGRGDAKSETAKKKD